MGVEELMQITPLCAADASRYRELMLHAYVAAADAFTSTADERAAEPASWWVARIAHPQGLGQAFGAIVGDRLVGTVAIEFNAKPKTRHRAQLIGMFVEQSARRGGTGRALVRAALAEVARRPEIRVVFLSVTEGNEAAVALYQGFGFRPFGIEPLAIATPAGFKSKLHMWLELAPAALASIGFR